MGGPCNSDPPPSTTDSALFTGIESPGDGIVVSPGQALVKTWRLKNTGTSTWGGGYQLVFRHGDQMSGPNAIDVPATAPGAEVDLSVNLTAPSNSGDASGYWQLRNPQGTYFGPEIWVSVNVVAPDPGGGKITAFDVSPASPSAATSVHVVARATSFPEFRSMRFVLGEQVFEMTNFRQVGDQVEISADWDTSTLPRGDYTLIAEVARNDDPNWTHPERQVKTYTLTGTPAPTNRPPERPILDTPYNWYLKDAAGASAPVQMCVHPASDPDGDTVSYWFELSSSTNGNSNSGWITSTCWQPTLAPGHYTWRVKASDGSAESDWSVETWNFSVAGGGVYIGSDQLFAQNTNDTHLCVFVTYDGILAPEVRAWINEAPDGSDTGAWRQLDHYGPSAPPDCTQSNYHGFWIRSPVYQTGNHRIRISAVKQDSGASATKETYYNIAYIRPSDPQLIAPATSDNNGTWWNTPTIAFRWQESLRADTYQLRVSTSSDIWNDPAPVLNQIVNAGTTVYTHTFSQDYDQLYWGIRASNSAGNSDSPGGVWFGIDRVKPSCTVLGGAAVEYESVFQVNWSGSDNAAGVRSYDIQYRDSERGTWSDWLTGVPAAKTFEVFNGQPGHTYAFRCRATDNANNTGDYPPQADTTVTVDPASRPPTPWWDAAYSAKRNLIIQNEMPGVTLPVGYPVHLHFDSTTAPTAAELYAASQSAVKCDDLRIVYNNTTELDRVVQNCNSSAIDIWFRSQVPIAGSDTDSTAHQLYYGNAGATNPPAQRNGVLYPEIDANHLRVFDMREGQGFTLHDATGNGDATMGSELSWITSGKFGPAVVFPGDLTPEPRPAVYAGIGPQPACTFTAELWLKRSPEHRYGGILAEQENGGPNPWRWIFSIESERLSLGVEGAGQAVKGNRSLSEETFFSNWHHFAVTYDCSNGETRFYIDGQLDAVRTFPGNGLNPATAPLRIGNNAIDTQRIGASMSGFALSNIIRTSFPYGAFAAITAEPTTNYGDPLTPPAGGAPDLAVVGLDTFPNPGGGVLVQTIVENRGNLSTQNDFYTDIYLDRPPVGAGDYTGSIEFWVNDPITAGARITLTTLITDLTSLGRTPVRIGNSISEITGTLYAQTDSAGVISETNNVDNIFSTGTEICMATDDMYEPDGSAGTATNLPLDTSQTHNINTLVDEDWFQLQVSGGETYILQTGNLSPSADTYLYLYDTDGTTLLAANDDYGGTLASYIEWTPIATGTYYAVVKHWNPNVAGCDTSYTISLNEKVYSAAPAVVGFAPHSNIHTTPLTVSVSATYDQIIDPTTVSTSTFAVYAMQTGLLSQVYGVHSDTVRLTPVQPFKPGELVQVSATTATLNLSGQGPISPTVWQFRTAAGGGSGLFVDSGQTAVLSSTTSVALGDLDGDGDLDAFIGNWGQGDKVWLNNGAGVFNDSGQSLGNTQSEAVALGDLDRDGDLDAFVVNGYGFQVNKVWLNDGAGIFSDSGQSVGFSDSKAVALGDLDGDGDLDAFVGNWNSGNRVWLNDGRGVFSDSGQNLGGSADSWAVALGDVDGDGDLDAFVGNWDQTNRVWLNNGAGIFSDSGQSLGNSGSYAVDLGDLDGDGDLDAFVGNIENQANTVWLNDGTGAFSDSGQSLGNSYSPDVALGDVDGDGDLDAFVGNWNNQANKVWLNDGTGAFSDNGQSLGNSYSADVALGDVDGDGDLDAFVGNWNNQASKVWLNETPADLIAADFTASPTSGAAPLTVNFSNTSTGDYTSSQWDFGDGTISSQTNPTHTYNSAGVYTTTLTVSGPGGSDTFSRTITVYRRVAASFSASPVSGPAPLMVKFSNTSSGDYSTSQWDFGDGTTSGQKNPTHQYTQVGKYTVNLTVSGLGGVATKTRTNYISVNYYVYLPVILR